MRHADVFFSSLLTPRVDLGNDLGAHWILEGVPKTITFEEIKNRTKKTQSKQRMELFFELFIGFLF